MEIKYTDGDSVESRILELLKTEKERSSSALVGRGQYSEWAVEYHLCPERSNLLRPFDFSGLDVLEIGAGMGAVSRLLAENARHLTVIEGTQARYNVLAERLKDLSNWNGVVGNLQDVQLDQTFDVVCVIGVLEYSELFVRGDAQGSPFDHFLAKAKSFLKPDGVLILAIENRMGLKYLAGAGEDHLGTSFDGVCGYAAKPTPKTFSRKELGELLAKAGLAQQDWYYPYPDYKIPSAVLSQTMHTQFPRAAASLASVKFARDYLNNDGRLFPELLATRGLADAGLLSDMANSFLVFGSSEPDSSTKRKLLARSEKGEIAWHYSNRRRIATETSFTLKSAELRVTKQPLLTAEQPIRSGPQMELGWKGDVDVTFLQHPTFVAEFVRAGYFGAPQDAIAQLSQFLTWSFAYWNLNLSKTLPGRAVDAVAPNSVVTGEGFALFDLEWETASPIPASWFVLRNLLCLFAHRSVFMAAGSTLGETYTSLCLEHKITPQLASDLALEAEFQHLADGDGIADHAERLRVVFETPFTDGRYPRRPSVYQNRQRLKKLENRYRHAESFIRRFKPAALKAAIKNRLRPAPVEKKNGSWIYRPPATPSVWHSFTLKFDRAVDTTDVVVTLRTREDNLRLPLKPGKRRAFSVVLRLRRPLQWIEIGNIPGVEVRTIRLRPLNRVVALARMLSSGGWSLLQTPAVFLATLKKGMGYLLARRTVELRLLVKRIAFSGNVVSPYNYGSWVERYDTLSEADLVTMRRQSEAFSLRPLVSILMPVYNTDERWLVRAIESVKAQAYPNWELCIADDASTLAHIRPLLGRYAAEDPRVRVTFRKANGHISAASNTALSVARGEWVALLDHDDELTPHALFMIVEALNRNPNSDLLYTDEDKIDEEGRRCDPHFKSDWNRWLFYSYNFICHFCVMRTSVVRNVGGFKEGLEGSQDYDLFLRVTEKLNPDRIQHIARIAYHWRIIAESTASSLRAKPYATEAARTALREHLKRISVAADVLPGPLDFHRVRLSLPENRPRVTAIICTRDRVELLREIVEGLLKKTAYAPLEILVVDNQSREADTLTYLGELAKQERVRVLPYDAPFNFAAMNNLAAREARGELVLFLNNDLEVIHSDWLSEMVGFALQPDVGAVGASLIYANGAFQHAGVILGIGGFADHLCKGLAGTEMGYYARAQVHQSLSAVTGACLLMQKSLFLAVGGFDDKTFAIAYNDVDLCLRLRKAGYSVVYTPYARLYHLESASRGSDETPENRPRFTREQNALVERWGPELAADPFYNPNLSLLEANFELAFPPRRDTFPLH